MLVAPGATSISVDVFFADDTGAALTGKVAADFPLCKWSGGSNTADTTITLSDLAAITTAHPNDNTAGGVKEREGGWYRIDLPNNALTSAGRKTITFAETTNKRILAPFVDVQYAQANVSQWLGSVPDALSSGKIAADLKLWLTAAPNALVSGRADVSVGALASAVITAASIAAAALNGKGDWNTATPPTAAAIATVIWQDLMAGADFGTASSIGALLKADIDAAISSRSTYAGGAVASVTAGVTVATNNDKTGYGLSAAAVQAIWDALTSALTTAGSIGKRLVDFVTSLVYTAPPSAASISTQVWTEPIPGSFGGGSAGAKLNSAGSAGDPWSTAVPGAYGAGTAGKILGTNLDAAVSGVAAASATSVWAAAIRTLTAFAFTPAVTLTSGERTAMASALLNTVIPNDTLTVGQALYVTFLVPGGKFGTQTRSSMAPYTITIPFLRPDGTTVWSYVTTYTDSTFSRTTGRTIVAGALPTF